MKNKKLLFVTTRLFWPTDSGRKLSLYYYCKGIHEKYNCDIYIYSFLESGQTEKDIEKKPEFIKDVRLAKPIGKIDKIQNLATKTLVTRKWPIQCSLYYSRQNSEQIKKYCDEIQPDYIFTDMIRTSMYYDAFRHSRALKVLDMDDLLSARYERQLHAMYKSNISGQYSGRLPGIINKLIGNQMVRDAVLTMERDLTAKAEIHYSKLYDKVIFVSAVETAYLNKKLPGKTITIPVGINAVPERELAITPEKYLLSYVGNLKVAANVDTLHWIISDILPKIHHNVKFMVIGKCPDDIKEKYKGNNHVIFTGRVDNLVEYIRKSQIFLSPILYGTGIKTKILEAMSMGVPVVTNDVGAEGIAADDGKEFWVRNDSIAIAEQVDYLLEHYDVALRVAEAGKKLVEDKYEWNRIWEGFQEVLT
ncbi:glycosyltransferase [Dialister hominis]|uniref:glycosyltransferase n=1 Tax=Dialister hominis TaxID=2582419 RepID=UPI003FF0FBBC